MDRSASAASRRSLSIATKSISTCKGYKCRTESATLTITQIAVIIHEVDTFCDFGLTSFVSLYLFVEVFLTFLMVLAELTDKW